MRPITHFLAACWLAAVHNSISIFGTEYLEPREVVVGNRVMLDPLRRPGQVVGNYQLTEFVRVQGDKPHPERFVVDPVFFSPALKNSWYVAVSMCQL